jgi:hypothetical protein
MGKHTVDLKHMKLFVTIDKFNKSQYRQVLQGSNHKRPCRDDNGKYSDALPTERLGTEGFDGKNFLGKAWSLKYKGNKFSFPTLNEVFAGIMEEAKEELKKNSGCPNGS